MIEKKKKKSHVMIFFSSSSLPLLLSLPMIPQLFFSFSSSSSSSSSRLLLSRGLCGLPGLSLPRNSGRMFSSILAKQPHWYKLSDGDSLHGLPMKSNPGHIRRATLNDAKPYGLVPSVTTVLQSIHSSQLLEWGNREMMFAAWKTVIEQAGPRRLSELPKRAVGSEDKGGAKERQSGMRGERDEGKGKEEVEEDEVIMLNDAADIKLETINVDHIAREEKVKTSRTWDLEVFLARVIQNYLEKTLEAPTKGRYFHSIVENHLIAMSKGEKTPQWPERYQDYQLVFEAWMEENVAEIIYVEESFSCVYGFGGKCDAVFRLKDGTVAICDFKTQLASDGTFKMFPSWAAQLVAYAVGLGYPEARLLNMCFALGPTFSFQVKYWDGSKENSLNTVVEEMQKEGDQHHLGELSWTRKDVSEDQLYSEINKGYWEDFRLAFLAWCSPMAHSFQPHKVFESCKPIPTWEEILALGPERPLQLAVAKLQVIEPMKDDEEPNKK